MPFNKSQYTFIIGIDTGVNTGMAIWNRSLKKFDSIKTVAIHEAMFKIKDMIQSGYRCFIRVEDPRQRKWFGKSGREKLQGAGSVKRDAKMWEDFLTDIGADFEMVAPKNNKTKLDAGSFCSITGWKASTNEHSRDAGMLVFGY